MKNFSKFFENFLDRRKKILYTFNPKTGETLRIGSEMIESSDISAIDPRGPL
jgi:hypothetical protein